jgi:hypothetical protein
VDHPCADSGISVLRAIGGASDTGSKLKRGKQRLRVLFSRICLFQQTRFGYLGFGAEQFQN